MIYPLSVKILIICLAVLFVICQASVLLEKKFIRYLTTPLLAYFVTAIAAIGVYRYGTGIEWMLLAAFGLGIIADTILMQQIREMFIFGLLFFLGTHIFYIIVFSEWYQFLWSDIPVASALLAGECFFVYRFYKAGRLGNLAIPVTVYITALSLIVFFSVNGALRNGDTNTYLRMTGAILFYFSDAILGWTQFVKYYRFTPFYVWMLYMPGQFLIAMSLFY